MVRRNRAEAFESVMEISLTKSSHLRSLLAALVVLPAWTFACGIRWDVPSGAHFSGVDTDGSVLWSERLDTLDLGGGLRVPITAMFKSNWMRTSPYLGAGWMLPLLEANIVQVSQNKYQMRQPGGWFRTFHIEKKAPTLLNGGTWQAEIRKDAIGETITAWAECGDKLVFSRGKIQSMAIKGRTFAFVYSGNRVVEIRENGAAKLSVVWNDNGTVKALEFNGKRLELELSERPRVEAVAGQNVVGGLEKSLTRVRSGTGWTKDFEFAVDKALRPTLKTGNRLLTWDSATQLILSDEKWNYTVALPETPTAYAAIERKTAKGEREFWHEDRARGIETVESADGIKTVTTLFPKGAMAGRKRKQEQFKNGQLVESKSWAYDDRGLLIREISNGKITTFLHDDKDRMESSHDESGKRIMSFGYDDKDRLVKKTDGSDNVVWERAYDEQGRIIRELTNGMLFEHQFAADGTKKKFQKDPETGNILRRWSYNVEGKNTEFTTLKGEVFNIAYDAFGRQEKMFRNGALTTLFIYDGANLVKQAAFRPGGKSIENITEYDLSLGARKISKVLSAGEFTNSDVAAIMELVTDKNILGL